MFIFHKRYIEQTIYPLKLRLTFLYKNQYSFTVEFFHAIKLPYITTLVTMRQKYAPYALASRGYYLLYVARTIYYIHIAVVVDTTSSKKSHITYLVVLVDLLIYNNELELKIVKKLIEYFTWTGLHYGSDIVQKKFNSKKIKFFYTFFLLFLSQSLAFSDTMCY